jgi:chaperonin cofactor prefoldin
MAQKETLTKRVTRLEDLHADLAVKMAVLVDAQIKTEERIEKLVSAIGELIRRNGTAKR